MSRRPRESESESESEAEAEAPLRLDEPLADITVCLLACSVNHTQSRLGAAAPRTTITPLLPPRERTFGLGVRSYVAN